MSGYVNDLLIDAAAEAKHDERMRRAAVRTLEARGVRGAVPQLEAIWITVGNSLRLRQQACTSALALNPRKAADFLDRIPDFQLEPVLYDFVRRLRIKHGLPGIPESGL